MIPITVQMIVKNEDRWLWYAITSVINYVSHIIIFDTNSKDQTVNIINSFPKAKITFEQKGEASPNRIVALRQEQLEKTSTEWFLLVDGDEVWPKDSIVELLKTIENNSKKSAVVVKDYICLGDIMHYQDERAGEYVIGRLKGHLNIRAYRKISGYSWVGTYPNEAYSDKNNIPIQNKVNDLVLIDKYYWHLRHLPRSTKFSNQKRKFEIGKQIDKSKLPEAFFLKTPSFVPSPWIHYSFFESILSQFMTPFRKFKRFFI